MTTETAHESSGYGKIKAWIAGVTGVLIVVPALINAGTDIWDAIAGLPKSEAEKTNVTLFKQHFGESPLHRGEIPIKTSLGTVKMELEVHKGGDIYVRYGERSQWFRSPVVRVVSAPSFIGAAHAASLKVEQTRPYQQLDTFKKGGIFRERYFANGTKESYRINPTTGKWSNPTIGSYQKLPDAKQSSVPTFEYPAIDLTQ